MRPAVLLGAALLLTGCTSDAGTSDAGSGLDGTWHLVDGRDAEGVMPATGGRGVTLVVDGTEASGTSACNTYSGTVTVDDERVGFSGLGGTEMGCDPDVMDVERRYLAGLDAVEVSERTQSSLVLSGEDVVLEFRVTPPQLDADLVRTAWLLESLIDGDSVSSALPGGRLTLVDEQLFGGTTGCRRIDGSFTRDGDTVTVTGLEYDESPCPPAYRTQHQHMIDVLRQGFTFRIEGDRMTATSDSGLGLEFRTE